MQDEIVKIPATLTKDDLSLDLKAWIRFGLV